MKQRAQARAKPPVSVSASDGPRAQQDRGYRRAGDGARRRGGHPRAVAAPAASRGLPGARAGPRGRGARRRMVRIHSRVAVFRHRL